MNGQPRIDTSPCRLAILGSGTGTNADAIIRYTQEHENAGFTVVLVVSTKANAGITTVAEHHQIPCVVIEQRGQEFTQPLVRKLADFGVEMIALAGFMRVLDQVVIEHVGNAVLNVHPSLLPRYGGKGMYGIHVHEAVLSSGDEFSGATVHLVNEQYDEGRIIAQQTVPVEGALSAALLQERVKRIEHELFPAAISDFANNNVRRTKLTSLSSNLGDNC